MSACDTCHTPGHCCRQFTLNTKDEGTVKDMPWLFALAWLAEKNLPFVPWYQTKKGAWLFWCPNLQPSGRCGDYENRPGLCIRFQPKSNGLCILYKEEG